MQHSTSHAPAVERHLLPARGGLRRLAPGEFVDRAVAQHDTLVVADGRRLIAALLRACARTTVVRSINAVHATADTPRHHNVLRHVCEQREGWGCVCVCRRRGGSGGIGCAQRMARLSQERDACSYIKESAVALTSTWALPPRASCLLLAAAITDQQTQQQQQRRRRQQQQQQEERWQRPRRGRERKLGQLLQQDAGQPPPPHHAGATDGTASLYCYHALLSRLLLLQLRFLPLG